MTRERLIIFPDGPDHPVAIPIANGFVQRIVSAVSGYDVTDAQRVATILNKHFAQGGTVE
jgi:translation initiation factor 1 (eIF-1/SUI1)